MIPYAGMIMALPKQLIGFTGPYTVLTIVLCNDLRKIIYLGGFACVVALLDLVQGFHHQLDDLFCYSGYSKGLRRLSLMR